MGGTNITDFGCTLCSKIEVVAKSKKSPITSSITLGIPNALRSVLKSVGISEIRICLVKIGTRHFPNAALQRKNLAFVTVVRLCGPASRALPPFCDSPYVPWPEEPRGQEGLKPPNF